LKLFGLPQVRRMEVFLSMVVRGVNARRFRARERIEREGHEDLVVIAAILLQGVDFMAVCDEAEMAIEAFGCLIVADDDQLKQFDMVTGVIDNCADEAFGDAGTTRSWTNVHAP